MDNERLAIYEKIEEMRKSKVLVYVTGDRPGAELQISYDALDTFLNHLDEMGKVERISLILYTCGGETLAAWNIINLIKEFCNELEIIVPNKCRSAGTLMALGANRIIMTKQATLGPIDPSINSLLNPVINNNGQQIRIAISVESVKGYFDLLKNELKATSNNAKSQAYNKLVDFINPVLLGNVYRAKKQIKMLASKLLKFQRIRRRRKEKIVSFLCSDTGSHDYTLNRTEAESIGLKIEKPNDLLYAELKKWYINICDELKLKEKFDVSNELKSKNEVSYESKRGIIESIKSGTDYFVTKGRMTKLGGIPNGLSISQIPIQDEREYDKWRHENGN
jgi:Periplasmic serine proteases (ClpP class)